MGAGKRKLEQVRAAFLAELDSWMFPPSEWETRTVEEIQSLPVVKVERYPDHVLEYMRMPERQCHANARFMQDHDPEQRLRQVTGWWLQEGSYVLHSVVDQQGKLVCVTPAPLHRDPTFEFIPDAKIEWREQGDYRVPYRDNIEIGRGVRVDPLKTMTEIDMIRQRLLSGMNPYEAVRMPQRMPKPE